MLCADTVADHDGDRRCKTERTRAAYDEDGDSPCKRKVKGLADEQPHDERHNGDAHDRGHENAGDLVGKLCDRRLCCGGVAHHLDYL